MADKIASIIKLRRESVLLFSHLNQQLSEHADEIVAALAAQQSKIRQGLIQTIFLEVVKLCNKESFISKHAVSKISLN